MLLNEISMAEYIRNICSNNCIKCKGCNECNIFTMCNKTFKDVKPSEISARKIVEIFRKKLNENVESNNFKYLIDDCVEILRNYQSTVDCNDCKIEDQCMSPYNCVISCLDWYLDREKKEYNSDYSEDKKSTPSTPRQVLCLSRDDSFRFSWLVCRYIHNQWYLSTLDGKDNVLLKRKVYRWKEI